MYKPSLFLLSLSLLIATTSPQSALLQWAKESTPAFAQGARALGADMLIAGKTGLKAAQSMTQSIGPALNRAKNRIRVASDEKVVGSTLLSFGYIILVSNLLVESNRNEKTLNQVEQDTLYDLQQLKLYPNGFSPEFIENVIENALKTNISNEARYQLVSYLHALKTKKHNPGFNFQTALDETINTLEYKKLMLSWVHTGKQALTLLAAAIPPVLVLKRLCRVPINPFYGDFL